MEFYQSRDAKCLKPVQKLLGDFKDEHPYFFYLWLDWNNRLKQAKTPDCKNPTKLLPHKEMAHVPSNLATRQQQILRLFQTELDAASQMSIFPFEYRRMNRLRLCRNLTSSR